MALDDLSLPPNNRAEDDPDHVPDHNLIVAAVQAIIDSLISPTVFESSGAGNVGLTVKMAPFQTADGLQVTDDADTVLFSVDDDGRVTAGAPYATNAMLRLTTDATTTAGVRIKLVDGQTANAFAIRDDQDNTLMWVAADGTVNGPNIGTVPGSSPAVTYSPLLVLDAAEAVPASTLAGTVVLRRPAS